MPTIGPSQASSFASDSASGGAIAWSDPGNAQADDAAVAFASGGFSGGATHYLTAQNVADFSAIPDEATVTQIVVRMEAHRNAGGGTVTEAKLIVGGVVQADSQHAQNPGWANSDPSVTTYTFAVNLTGAQVKAADFGFAIAGTVQQLSGVSIDYLTFEATYEESGNVFHVHVYHHFCWE